MKKILLGMFVALLAFSIPGLAWASMLTGQLIKIEGSVYVIKGNSSGKEHRILVDETTAKEGKLKEGVQVEVEVDDVTGRAKYIKAKET